MDWVACSPSCARQLKGGPLERSDDSGPPQVRQRKKRAPRRYVVDALGAVFERVDRAAYVPSSPPAGVVPERLGTTFTMHDRGDGTFCVTHFAINHVECPSCRAQIGELCSGALGERTTSVHVDRKDAFYGRRW